MHYSIHIEVEEQSGEQCINTVLIIIQSWCCGEATCGVVTGCNGGSAGGRWPEDVLSQY